MRDLCRYSLLIVMCTRIVSQLRGDTPTRPCTNLVETGDYFESV